MLQKTLASGAAVMLVTLCSCTRAPKPAPADYESFQPDKGQWVIKVEGMEPAQAEKIRATIDEVSGVQKGSALVSPEGRYVVFKTTVPSSDGKAHGAVALEVTNKLKELGLRAGESKTRVW